MYNYPASKWVTSVTSEPNKCSRCVFNKGTAEYQYIVDFELTRIQAHSYAQLIRSDYYRISRNLLSISTNHVDTLKKYTVFELPDFQMSGADRSSADYFLPKFRMTSEILPFCESESRECPKTCHIDTFSINFQEQCSFWDGVPKVPRFQVINCRSKLIPFLYSVAVPTDIWNKYVIHHLYYIYFNYSRLGFSSKNLTFSCLFTEVLCTGVVY